MDQLQPTTLAEARSHCPPDVEPDAYVLNKRGDWLPLVAVADWKGPRVYFPWFRGEIGAVGYEPDRLRALLRCGLALLADDPALAEMMDADAQIRRSADFIRRNSGCLNLLAEIRREDADGTPADGTPAGEADHV